MNYFEIRQAVKILTQYRELALKYWEALPEHHRDWMARRTPPPESPESLQLREQISRLYPVVNGYSAKLGVPVTIHSVPAPAVGGVIVPVNLLRAVVDREAAHEPIPYARILDAINQCIGAAEKAEKSRFWRMVLPWYWVIDLPAFIIRVPFLILQKVGLPSSIEENLLSQIIKVVMMIVILAVMGYFGVQVTFPDLLKFFER